MYLGIMTTTTTVLLCNPSAEMLVVYGRCHPKPDLPRNTTLKTALLSVCQAKVSNSASFEPCVRVAQLHEES